MKLNLITKCNFLMNIMLWFWKVQHFESKTKGNGSFLVKGCMVVSRRTPENHFQLGRIFLKLEIWKIDSIICFELMTC